MHDDRRRRTSSGGGGGSRVGCGGGCGTMIWVIGVILAGFMSFLKGNTLIWVAINAVCGWFYVLYLCLGCAGGFPPGVFDRPASELVEGHTCCVADPVPPEEPEAPTPEEAE